VSANKGTGVKSLVESVRDALGFRGDLWVVGAQVREGLMLKGLHLPQCCGANPYEPLPSISTHVSASLHVSH
jgi:hypothetical protein